MKKYNYSKLSNNKLLRTLNFHEKQQGRYYLSKKKKKNFVKSKHEQDRQRKMTALKSEIDKRGLTYRTNRTYALAVLRDKTSRKSRKTTFNRMFKSKWTKKRVRK
jgi:hypothetical protein